MVNPFRASRKNAFRPPNQEMHLDGLTAQGHLAEWHVEAAIVVQLHQLVGLFLLVL